MTTLTMSIYTHNFLNIFLCLALFFLGNFTAKNGLEDSDIFILLLGALGLVISMFLLNYAG